MELKPEVSHTGLLDMQVCVPAKFTDKEVVEFAERINPCGTRNGWVIRKQSDKNLLGSDERVKCNDKEDFVHIMLDA